MYDLDDMRLIVKEWDDVTGLLKEFDELVTDLRHLRAENALMRECIEDVEIVYSSDTDPYQYEECPWCAGNNKRNKEFKHKPDCLRQRALELA